VIKQLGAQHGHLDGVIIAETDHARADEVLRIAEEVEKPRSGPEMVAPVGTLRCDQGLRPILILEGGEFFRYLIQGLFPWYLLPFSFPPCADAFQGMVQLVRVVEPFDRIDGPLTYEAVAGGVIGISGYLHYRAVPDMHEDTAIVVTEKTGGLFNGRFRTHQNPPLLISVIARFVPNATKKQTFDTVDFMVAL